MSEGTILVIEDDADIRELLRFNLEKEGFTPLESGDGDRGLAMAREHCPDCILLDLMLPGMDGLEICRRLAASSETRDIPILILTARGEEMDRVVGLSLGADDYVVKPFSVRELMLRVRAVLRRRRRPESGAVDGHGIHLDPHAHIVTVQGEEVPLTATEFRLLEDLMRHAGIVRTREQLLERVWGYAFEGYARTVDTHMRRLRAKLGEQQKYLETVRGVGYRFNSTQKAEE
ncbi:MAG: response regulator [Desulfovibrionaceae bacterium]|nr:response regulator [Desulfovibrionaceae bacterium]